MKTLKLLAMTLMTLFVTHTAHAVDNTIYIEQVGGNATITVTQDGAGNRVRGIQGVGTGNTTPANLTGNAITVNIEQIGATNVLNLGVNTTTGAGLAPTYINYEVAGNNNTGTINLNNNGLGVNATTNLDITQQGGGNTATINILGTNNALTAVQTGGTATLTATINATDTVTTINTAGGTNNIVTLNMTGNEGLVGITTVGATNTHTITQTGGGANGHQTILDVLGTGNTFTIAQTGAMDTVVNIGTTGNNNVYNITTND